MSRAYRVEVYVKGISMEQLRKVMKERFWWEEMSLSDYKGIVCFTGEGFLSGGQAEKEAHEQISAALKALSPRALVSTKWTYLEELPCSDYGDSFDVDTALPETPLEEEIKREPTI